MDKYEYYKNYFKSFQKYNGNYSLTHYNELKSNFLQLYKINNQANYCTYILFKQFVASSSNKE